MAEWLDGDDDEGPSPEGWDLVLTQDGPAPRLEDPAEVQRAYAWSLRREV